MTQRRMTTVVFGSVLLFAAALAQAQGEPTRDIVHVAGDLYRAQNNAHFTVFLVTPEGIILSDPINYDFSQWLRAELDRRFGLPVKYVLYSHHDWDHASGGRVFADTAEFVAHKAMPAALAMPPAGTALPAAAAELDADRSGRIERSEATGSFAAQFENYDDDRDGALSGAEIVRGPLADVYPPTRLYDGRTTITLGGKRVEMIYVGPTHATDMTVLHFPEEDAMFLVDFVAVKRLPFQSLPDVDVDDLVSTIRRIEEMDFSIAVGGHADIGTKADITNHREYIEDLRDAVAAGMAAGLSLAELKASIRMEQYSDWGSYDAWLPLNIEGMHRILSSRR